MYLEIVVLASSLLAASAQNLELIVSNITLPSRTTELHSLYDGNDSIYILEGFCSPSCYPFGILKYSISQGSVLKIGSRTQINGCAVWAGNETILYFGGYDGYNVRSDVWQIKTSDPDNWTLVSNMPYGAYYTTCAWNQGEYSYVFTGTNDDELISSITRYSSKTNLSDLVANLPLPATERYWASSIWDDVANKGYIFGGRTFNYFYEDIFEFNPSTGLVTKLNATLPSGSASSCAIWTGKYAYMIGGFPSSGSLTPPLVRFDPSNEQVVEIPVSNVPQQLQSHACAYVEKLNRMYIFGGSSFNSGYSGKEIMYIDL